MGKILSILGLFLLKWPNVSHYRFLLAVPPSKCNNTYTNISKTIIECCILDFIIEGVFYIKAMPMPCPNECRWKQIIANFSWLLVLAEVYWRPSSSNTFGHKKNKNNTISDIIANSEKSCAHFFENDYKMWYSIQNSLKLGMKDD